MTHRTPTVVTCSSPNNADDAHSLQHHIHTHALTRTCYATHRLFADFSKSHTGEFQQARAQADCCRVHGQQDGSKAHSYQTVACVFVAASQYASVILKCASASSKLMCQLHCATVATRSKLIVSACTASNNATGSQTACRHEPT